MRVPPAIGIVALALVAPAHALRIEVNYDHDSGGFFNNPAARVALEQAAVDLGAVIDTRLGELRTLSFTGGGSTRLDVWPRFDHPSTVAPLVRLMRFNIDADAVRLYVGSAPLGGNQLAGALPFAMSVAQNLGGGLDDYTAAANAATAALTRGGGPVIGRQSIGNASGEVDVLYGVFGGSATFNLNAAWHFDLHSLPAPGTSDLYSVALHEMVHMLGAGTSETWAAFANETTWTWSGPRVQALLAGGSAPLTVGGVHFAEGTMSLLLDGTPQEALMDPTLQLGTRKGLTRLDLAMLEDLGYTIVPEPSPAQFLALGALLALAPFGRRRGRRRPRATNY